MIDKKEPANKGLETKAKSSMVMEFESEKNSIKAYYHQESQGCTINIFQDKEFFEALLDRPVFLPFVRECRSLIDPNSNDKQKTVKIFDGTQGSTNLIRVYKANKDGFYTINIVKDIYHNNPPKQASIDIPEAELQKIINCYPNI